MNCQEFAAIVHEFAREERCNLPYRAEALEHAGSCMHCSALLADARLLASGLAGLAAETADASPELESRLCEAYRRNQEATHSFRSAPTAVRSRFGWRAAKAAAMILITASATVLFLLSRRSETPERPEPSLKPRSPIVELRSGANAVPGAKSGEIPGITRGYRKPAATPGIRTAVRPRVRSDPESSGAATDFLPVTYVGNLQDFGSLQIVRARVPRTTMVSFGLPIVQERADSPVTADMLVSPDGVVRAIRFVR